MNHYQKISEYYNRTEKDYKSLWHYKLDGPPALHLGYYDEKATRHKDAIRRVNEILADFSGIKPGDRVLDAGCGLGQAAIWLAEERKAVVTGISIVKEQVEKAAVYAKEAGASGVTFVHADYLQTPFEDGYFDVVWGIESVCHALDKSLFYKEAFRILKPGGRVVLADCFRVGRPLSPANEKLLKEAFSGWQIHDLDTPEEHTSHAEHAGLKIVEIRDVTDNVKSSYKILAEHVRNLLWLGYILNWVGIIGNVRLDNAKSSGKQAKALQSSAFRYMHLLAVKP